MPDDPLADVICKASVYGLMTPELHDITAAVRAHIQTIINKEKVRCERTHSYQGRNSVVRLEAALLGTEEAKDG